MNADHGRRGRRSRRSAGPYLVFRNCSSFPAFISIAPPFLPLCLSFLMLAISPVFPLISCSSPPTLSIYLRRYLHLPRTLFYFSLKEYIQVADKCNGPLAGSPLQLGLGRHFSYCMNPPALFPLPFFFFHPSCSWRMLIHRGMVTIHWSSKGVSDGCGSTGSALMRGKRLRSPQPWCQIYRDRMFKEKVGNRRRK